MPIYGQTWFLSLVSGLIAVALYHIVLVRKTSSSSESTSDKPKPTVYIGVFFTVALLVYMSFVVAHSAGTCKMIDQQADIRTGSSAPF